MRPHILDRYVLREFTIYFLLCLLFFVGVFSIVDIFEKMDRFLDAHAGLADVLGYFLLGIPSVLVLVLPMTLLLSALLVLTQFEKWTELTAMNVAGRSFLRIACPMLGVAVLACLLSFGFEEYFVPRANAARRDFMNYRVAHIRVTSPTQKENLIYLGSNGRVYLIRVYLIPEQRMVDPAIQFFEGGRLKRRIDAREARWDGRRWVLSQAVLRFFAGDTERASRYERLPMPELEERPADFAAEDRSAGELTLSELSSYIHRLAESGRPTERYEVDYHIKISYPLINLIALLLSVGIAAQLRRGSAALAFGLSALTSFAFYGLVATARALGQAGVVVPWLAAWLGHAVFGGVAAWLNWKSPR